MHSSTARQAPVSAFISYSHQDLEFVRALRELLVNCGIEVHWDRGVIGIGDTIPREIQHAIDKADRFILVHSKASLKSTWVGKEIGLALAKENSERCDFILPLCVDSDIQLRQRLRDRLHTPCYQDKVSAFRKVVNACLETTAKKRNLPKTYTKLRLPEWGEIDDVYKLQKELSHHPYQYERTRLLYSSLRQYATDRRISPILTMAAHLVVEENVLRESDVVGLCATFLSTFSTSWLEPQKLILAKLESVVNKMRTDDGENTIGITEPLAFALARKGISNVHRRQLQTVLGDENVRQADYLRFLHYCGESESPISAIIRHSNDDRRNGLLPANDISRLIMLTPDLSDKEFRHAELVFEDSCQTMDSLGENGILKNSLALWKKATSERNR